MDYIFPIGYQCKVVYIDLSYYNIVERSFKRRSIWDS